MRSRCRRAVPILSLLLGCVAALNEAPFSGPIHNLKIDEAHGELLQIYADEVYIGSYTAPFENAVIFPSVSQELAEIDVSNALVYSYIPEQSLDENAGDIQCVNKPDQGMIGCYWKSEDEERHVAPGSIVHVMLPETKIVEGNELAFGIFKGSKLELAGPNIDTLYKVVSVENPEGTGTSQYSIVNARINNMNIGFEDSIVNARLVSTDDAKITGSEVNVMFSEQKYYRFLGKTNCSGKDCNFLCQYEEYSCPEKSSNANGYDFGVLNQEVTIKATSAAQMLYSATESVSIKDDKAVFISAAENYTAAANIFVFRSTEGKTYVQSTGENAKCEFGAVGNNVIVAGEVINVYLSSNVEELSLDFENCQSSVFFETKVSKLNSVAIKSGKFAAHVLDISEFDLESEEVAIGSYSGRNGIIKADRVVLNGNPQDGLLVKTNNSNTKVEILGTKDNECKIIKKTECDTTNCYMFTCKDKQDSDNVLSINCPDIQLYMTPTDISLPEWVTGLLIVISAIILIVAILVIAALFMNKKHKKLGKSSKIEDLEKEDLPLLEKEDVTSEATETGNSSSSGPVDIKSLQ